MHANQSLSSLPFHPTLNQWFTDEYGSPTEVQQASWPVIAAGHHALITAPTGSGKTLTAFMWSLSQFASGAYATGRTKVLYVSPLKALNNDIERNLLNPLKALQSNYHFPELRIQSRSGDTSTSQRQKMLRHPPDILITTPESLGLMLTTRNGRQALAWVETLILDEIHSVVDNRRGVHLMTNVERLAALSGEFQRIALSATVNPLGLVADFVGGYQRNGQPRDVQIINAPGSKQLQLRVQLPPAVQNAAEQGKQVWDPMSDTFREVIARNQATLFFTNSRRLAERITFKINENAPSPLAYAHHGSLSKDIRRVVESRLKEGALPAIVATNSLEMGIDIGHLDEVVLVQSPPSVAAAVQRIGRAGHRVGETSVGTLFPTHAHDFLEAAVLVQAINERALEPLQMMQAPLDVLAQLIISICASDAWSVEEMFSLITRAAPYRALSRTHFDGVIEMLSGRYSDARVRELKPRIIHDRLAGTVKANRGAVLALYSSGGTIPDRGYYQLRHQDSGAVLGELDEEFVWEANVGQTLTLGTQHWQIQRITHNDVLVRAAPNQQSAAPFWRSERLNRSVHFSTRIAHFLEKADALLAQGQAKQLQDSLTTEQQFEPLAAQELVDYLSRQRQHTETPLPHQRHLLLEWIHSGPAGYVGPNDPQQLVIHTLWGGRLNQPWALALKAAWLQAFGETADVHADNDAIVILLKQPVEPQQLLSLVTPENLLALLRESLETSGFFGARFRECAGRSLLLTKQKFNQRLPLWMSRLQAKKLMTQVKVLEDFPVLVETWRTCLDDEFDLPNLRQQLADLHSGNLTWTLAHTQTPSPFARNLHFDQVSRYMYADDTPEDDTLSALSSDLIGQALRNDTLRPSIDPQVIAEFEAKRTRRAPGYAPRSDEEWEEWLKERILIPADELPENFSPPTASRWMALDSRRWLTHVELEAHLYWSGLFPGRAPTDAPHVTDARDATDLAREILTFYGPSDVPRIEALLPQIPDNFLIADDTRVFGALVKGDTRPYWCDSENFEMLMRFQRASRRVQIDPRPAQELPLYWAALQGVGESAADNEQVTLSRLEVLRGYPASVTTWLEDLMPARGVNIDGIGWDAWVNHNTLSWRGTGKTQITLAYPEELELISAIDPVPDDFKVIVDSFIDPNASYTFSDIANTSKLSSEALNTAWWQAVWTGRLSSQTLSPLKQAHERNYTRWETATNRSSRRRLSRPTTGWQGDWRLTKTTAMEDPLTQLEADKERVRLLLERYGVLCRDVIVRERMPTQEAGKYFRWRDAFRALRLMELAGEVTTGHFFEDLSTPQFMSSQAIKAFAEGPPLVSDFWVAATDPAAPCGLSLKWPELPQRRATAYLVFHRAKLALVVENNGKDLRYLIHWDDPQIGHVHAVLQHLVNHRRIHIQMRSINQQPARSSPYLASLADTFKLVRDHKTVLLEPQY